MTVGEWHAMDTRMTYSIYDEESYREVDNTQYDNDKDWAKGHDSIKLDLSAGDIPDGVHRVMSSWFTEERNLINRPNPGMPVQFTGVKVKDGKFVPETLDQPCYSASCAVYGVDPEKPGVNIDHIFIEYLKWDERRQCIILTTGS